ncbi:hypothetical protein BDA99DRAFT_515904 [Phascolomyces articulosus]|uniref:Uncharacterized protein n=1 Tax=Phascolomyces articulosus TaxID=60185 RepID=A0AAD5K682_9FUNG|nr:hypothetical protein BDA99DRAFT_515904 [Phascolomyces articulosus]
MGNEYDKVLPAQKVGGMRVKNPNENRVPLKAEDREQHHIEQEEQDEEQMQLNKEIEFEQEKAFRQMQNESMRGQSPSMNAYNPNSKANNMNRGPNYNPQYQQRSMNH